MHETAESFFVFLLSKQKKSQAAELTLKLQKKKDEQSAANEMRIKKIEKLISDNGDLTVRNTVLKVCGISLNARKI